jgi:hypothetical protein
MDKKLLSALENLSFALEEIAAAIEKSKTDKPKSEVGGALTAGGLDKKIELIDKGIKQLMKDNKTIIRNQETLISLAKNKKESVISESGDKKKSSKVKDGIATVIAIAVGVLAIGLAFKIIGQVDFVSVMALAIALPLLAFAFEKIAVIGFYVNPLKLIIITVAIAMSVSMASSILSTVRPVNMIKLLTAMAVAGVLVILSFALGKIMEGVSKITGRGLLKLFLLPAVFYFLSLAVAVSSEVLRGVKPVNPLKLFSAILIAGMFAALGFTLDKIVNSMSKINIMGVANLFLMPLIFVALSMAIAQSSEHLRSVKPVNLLKLLTAILVAGVFAVLGYGLGKILDGFKGLDPVTMVIAVVAMPLILPALAESIAKSSVHFKEVKLVNLLKLLTAVAIGFIFVVLSFAVVQISKAMEKVSLIGMVLIPFVLVAFAKVIYETSLIFNQTVEIPYTKLLNILVMAAVISAIGFVFAKLTEKVLSKLSIIEVLKGAAMLLIIAGTITLASWILNQGTYEKYPDVFWAAGVGLSLGVFGLATVALGAVALTGIGLAAFAIGLPMILTLAGTIVETSKILAGGNYQTPGLLQWAVATALLYSTFTPIVILLGAIGTAGKVIEFFGGANPFETAKKMIVDIAKTIVEVSFELKKGDYKGGPTMEWAGGVAIALGAFSPLYAMLVANKIMSIFGGGLGPEDFNQAIRTVVGGIIFAAKEFAGTTAFQGGPKKEWAEGVGGAIGAFSPLYGILVKGGIMKAFGIGGVGIDDFNNAIKTITQGIIFSAGLFNKNSAAFDLERTPKKEWAERVGAAIQAFMPALDFVSKNSGIFKGDGSANLTKGLNATTNGIVYAAVTLGMADYSKVIPESWTKGLVTAVNGYLDLVTNVVYPKREWLWDALEKFKWVSDSILFTSKRFKEINANVTNFNSEWIGGFDKVVRTYVDLLSYYIYPKRKWIYDAIDKLGWVTYDIKNTAERFSYISKITSNIKPDWMANVDQNVRMYVDLADYLSSTDTDYSKVSTAVSNLEKISKGYSELAKGVSKLSAELEKIDMEKLTALRSLTGSIILMSLMDSDQFKEMMDALEDKAKIFVDVINELESKTEKTKPGKEAKPGIGVKSGGGEVKRPEKTMSDLFSVMEAIDLKMGELVSSNDNLSKYVDEIRSDDLNLKKKK